jgi:hypothetical protein
MRPRSLGLQGSIDGCPTNAELAGDLRWPPALSLELCDLGPINRRRAALVDASSLGLGDALHRRSLRRLVSNSANTPSISRKHLPAAVLVSIVCYRSVAHADAQ